MQAYERTPYAHTLTTRVAGRGDDDGALFVLLDDTIFYPAGGGQPADKGRIGSVPVIDVRRVDDTIRHYLAGSGEPPPVGSAVELQLDWSRRYDHMQQHTAQHLLTAVAADELGWQTTSFHLGAHICDIELDVAAPDQEALQRLEDMVADRIRAALAVTTRRVSPAQYDALEVRTRGLPEDHSGDIRLVEIDGIDRNTCGGTHLRSTAEIEALVLLDTEPMRGGTRLHWIAGGRVRQRLHRREQHAAAVRRLFETSDEEVVEAARAKLDKLNESQRELRHVLARLAVASANALRARPDAVLEAHFEDSDAGFLQAIARELLRAGESRPALLTAHSDSGSYFALCAAAPELDLRELGGQVADTLAGRGGGTPELIQGKAGSLEHREQAVALLRREARSDA